MYWVALQLAVEARAQIDGGTEGYRVYVVEVDGAIVGRIISTSTRDVPAPLARDAEYWEVDLEEIAGKPLTIRLVEDGVRAAPPRFDATDRWSARPTFDGPSRGVLAGGALTWRCSPREDGQGGALPAFQIHPGEGDLREGATSWVRDIGYGELFAGASAGDALSFEPTADLPFAAKRLTHDQWTPLD